MFLLLLFFPFILWKYFMYSKYILCDIIIFFDRNYNEHIEQSDSLKEKPYCSFVPTVIAGTYYWSRCKNTKFQFVRLCYSYWGGRKTLFFIVVGFSLRENVCFHYNRLLLSNVCIIHLPNGFCFFPFILTLSIKQFQEI